jgi:hypothetical protein
MCNWIGAILVLLAAGAVTGWANGHDDPPKKLTDAEISKLLVGKWSIEEGGDKGPKIKGTENYKKDGIVEAEATVDDGKNAPLKISLSGTWKVMDGVIVTKVTKSNVPDLIPEGHVSKDTVISIDDKEIKYKSEGGQEKTHKRLKD